MRHVVGATFGASLVAVFVVGLGAVVVPSAFEPLGPLVCPEGARGEARLLEKTSSTKRSKVLEPRFSCVATDGTETLADPYTPVGLALFAGTFVVIFALARRGVAGPSRASS
jgi:hypothetical protein